MIHVRFVAGAAGRGDPVAPQLDPAGPGNAACPLGVSLAERRRLEASELFLEGSRIDEDAGRLEEAEALYRGALELDPTLAVAHTNLGNVRFRLGDAEAAESHFRRALELDPSQPEAHFNLGYLLFGRGQTEQAISLFQRAIEADATFADAHFNLAMALERLGKADAAQAHWRRYLLIEPQGVWAELARRHLRPVGRLD